jgi:hypothetical protein
MKNYLQDRCLTLKIRNVIIFFVFLALLVSPVPASAQDDFGIPLVEGTSLDIGNGYYFNVLDVDPYYGQVRFSVTYNGFDQLNSAYNEYSSFYYDDSYLTLSFDIVDIITEFDTDYVIISNIYSYSITDPTGSIVISTAPDVDVYMDGDYVGMAGTYSENSLWIYGIQEGYHEIVLESEGYYSISKSIYVSPGETDYYSWTLESLIWDDGSYDDSYNDPDMDLLYGILGLISLFFLISIPLVFLLIIILFLRRKKSKAKSSDISLNDKTQAQTQIDKEILITAEMIQQQDAISVKSALEYKGAFIHYKVKVENPSTEPIGDIKVMIFVPDVFLLKEKEKSISMLEPGEGKTVTFELRPTGECGDCVVSGNITYYDYGTKKRSQMDVKNKMISIVCPVLSSREIDENAWRKAVNEMMIVEEDAKDLEVPAQNLFDIVTRLLKDMNLYMIKPEITSTPQLFTGVARFFAEGVAGMRYAAYVEVVGSRKSRLILKAWAEKEEALTGYYHKMLEEIEKRIDIKIFINDGVTQYHISTTTIQDSVLQRSNVETDMDAGGRRCPNCGRAVEKGEKFCMECGGRLD